jgi:hypothetical protein
MPTDESIWTRDVPLVADGDPVNAQTTNAPDLVLADRTAALKVMIDALETGQQIVLRDAPLATGISEGHTVYFAAASLDHGLAEALWQNLETDDARIEPSEKAIYTGVVISKSAAQVGDILMGGVAELTSPQVAVLFDGATPEENVYFLSSLVPGTVQLDVPAMRVRVLQYLGSNLIRVFPPSNDPITHTHKEYRLEIDDFEPVSFFDPDIVPSGATYGYDLTALSATSQSLSEVLLPAVGEGTFVYALPTPVGSCVDEGKHVEPELAFIDEQGIWWTGGSAPTCDVLLTVTVADAKGLPILNTIQSLTPDTIEILVNDGRVTVEFIDFEKEEDVAGSAVVKEIVGNLQRRGEVVEKIQAGVGATVSPSTGQGTVTVEFAGFSNFRIPANILNLNNTVTAVDGSLVIVKFPSNRDSELALQCLLPHLEDDSIFEAKIFAEFIKPGANQTPPAIEDIILKGTPDTAGVTPAAPVADTFPDFPGSITAGDIYLVESTSAFDLTGLSQGSIFYTLTASSPSPEFRLVSTGVRLVLK